MIGARTVAHMSEAFSIQRVIGGTLKCTNVNKAAAA